jgi:hypothetical protein
MGYCLHITKTDHPVNSKTRPITPAEWRYAISIDSDLQFDGRSKTRVVWYDDLGDERGRMLLHHGRAVAKNPSQEFIAKMTALAKLLGARVIGDDGEVYS